MCVKMVKVLSYTEGQTTNSVLGGHSCHDIISKVCSGLLGGHERFADGYNDGQPYVHWCMGQFLPSCVRLYSPSFHSFTPPWSSLQGYGSLLPPSTPPPSHLQGLMHIQWPVWILFLPSLSPFFLSHTPPFSFSTITPGLWTILEIIVVKSLFPCKLHNTTPNAGETTTVGAHVV